jgi:hypothetical protein
MEGLKENNQNLPSPSLVRRGFSTVGEGLAITKGGDNENNHPPFSPSHQGREARERAQQRLSILGEPSFP